MRRLDRYVLGTWLSSFFVTAAALLGLVLLADLVGHLEKFLEASVESRARLIARYYAVRVPIFFVWIAPMVSLCAAMLTLTRFSRANEVMPVLVSGRSLHRFLLPALLATVAVSVLAFFVDEKVNPRFQETFRDTARELEGDKDVENVVVSDRRGQDWFAEKYHPLESRLENVLVVRLGPDFRRISDVRAKQAFWKRSRKGWLLVDGVETEYDPVTQRRRPDRRQIPVEGLLVESDLRPVDIEETDQMFRLSTLSQLDRNIANYPYQPFWRVQWHGKWTMPLANVVLVLLGVPVLVKLGTRNVFAGVGISLGLGGVFFGAIVAFMDAGNTGRVDPMLAAWFPIVFFGALGLAMADAMPT